MKFEIKQLVIVLMAIALPLIVYSGGANAVQAVVTATPTPTAEPANYTTPSFTSFYACVFGVHIFPGADPMGSYTVNYNPNYVNTLAPTTGTVTVTIYGTDGVTPYANAIIAYYDHSTENWNYQNHVASDGTFTFYNVAPGNFDYAAYNPGFTHLIRLSILETTVTAGQTTNLKIVADQM